MYLGNIIPGPVGTAVDLAQLVAQILGSRRTARNQALKFDMRHPYGLDANGNDNAPPPLPGSNAGNVGGIFLALQRGSPLNSMQQQQFKLYQQQLLPWFQSVLEQGNTLNIQRAEQVLTNALINPVDYYTVLAQQLGVDVSGMSKSAAQADTGAPQTVAQSAQQTALQNAQARIMAGNMDSARVAAMKQNGGFIVDRARVTAAPPAPASPAPQSPANPAPISAPVTGDSQAAAPISASTMQYTPGQTTPTPVLYTSPSATTPATAPVVVNAAPDAAPKSFWEKYAAPLAIVGAALIGVMNASHHSGGHHGNH